MKAEEGSRTKPGIVVSGVNLTEMGPLSVFQDALSSLAAFCGDRYEITALVHRRDLIDLPAVTLLEFPRVKSSWLRRITFEYHACRGISARLQPHLWISMDNMTPNVTAAVTAVYCHNPSLFYRFSIRDLRLDWKFGLFTLFYRYLYAINIHRNDYVIVQQDWIRRRFQSLYGVERVIVAHPAVPGQEGIAGTSAERPSVPYRFFYPAYPRTFKNLEVVLDAARILEESGFCGFEVWLTCEGSVNPYARVIADRYSEVRSARWLGLLPRQRVFELYRTADCLLFASKLETWGMPITEFKTTGKPILAAELPYARETVGSYPLAAFFDPGDAQELAGRMRAAATGQPVFSAAQAEPIPAPFATGWAELWSLLLSHAGANRRTGRAARRV